MGTEERKKAMSFGPKHYVPVLKVKQGEKAALQEIPASLCKHITPLLEIVERTAEKKVSEHINTAFKGLKTALSHYPRCMLDAREINRDGETAVLSAFARAKSDAIVFTPVTGLTRTADLTPAMAYPSNGIAIRLTRQEFEAGGLDSKMRRFMATNKIDHSKTDLIVDLGPVAEMIQAGVSDLASQFLAAVPDKKLWRTLTLTACDFPKSMGAVGRESNARVDRIAWQVWQDDCYGKSATMERLPTYSDCAIQHTQGVEKFDPKTMQGSAAIRYTLNKEWLIIKGRGTRHTPPTLQFPGLAKKLVYKDLRHYYAGERHCSGCAGIKAAADGVGRWGSLTVWRRLGTIHHITKVAEQLAALPWP